MGRIADHFSPERPAAVGAQGQLTALVQDEQCVVITVLLSVNWMTLHLQLSDESHVFGAVLLLQVSGQSGPLPKRTKQLLLLCRSVPNSKPLPLPLLEARQA